jgi:hypothetical protein
MAWDQQTKEVESIAGDRRGDRRYAIHLDLRWKLIRRRRILETGVGRTLDLSSGGILIETEHQLPVGLNVELSVSWPVMLHNVSPMQLAISGKIVRCVGHRAAIRMTQHEFRTAATSAESRKGMAVASNAPVPLLAKPGMFFNRST